MGAVVNDDTLAELKCAAIAGSANNVLARDEHGYALRQLGILYAPDYVVNAGGLINVADELRGYSAERAKAKVEGIFGAVRDIFHRPSRGVPTSEAADRMAKDRMREISRLQRDPGRYPPASAVRHLDHHQSRDVVARPGTPRRRSASGGVGGPRPAEKPRLVAGPALVVDRAEVGKTRKIGAAPTTPGRPGGQAGGRQRGRLRGGAAGDVAEGVDLDPVASRSTRGGS